MRLLAEEKLHVIAVISNPVRYQSRYELYRKFEQRMLSNPKVNLVTVEIATGTRAFQITSHNNPNHLQLRSYDELWHKENMINLGVQHLTRLHPDWQFIATIDADVQFLREDWADETLHQLQHHHVVQMFQNAIFMGPNGQALNLIHSFMSQYLSGKPRRDWRGNPYNPHWHPGFCWAYCREAWDLMGGLVDFAILGAGDTHMALGFIGAIKESIHPDLHFNYRNDLLAWERKVEANIKRDVGFVAGTLMHYWHGSSKSRQYVDRWKILTRNKYDPRTDLRRDAQGLWQLEVQNERQRKLRDEIRQYFRQRNEDSIDL